MSVISAIVAARRHPGRFEIVVDDVVFAVLSIDAIERLQLSVGRVIAGLEDRIAMEAAELKVADRALNMLAFRARSSSELARALIRNGDDRALVDRVIARLQAQGLLNDAAFAQSFARAKVVGANHSRRRVQQDLAKKGVARDVSNAAITAVFEDEGVDQREIVEQAARRKLRMLVKLEPIVRRRRLYAFLARRGYDSDDIRRAMEAVGEELSDTESLR
jgi:regulatory protein